MQLIARLFLKLIGWKIVGQLPGEKKYILIMAPHTSNFDLIMGLFARYAVGVKIHFLAKSQVFVFPLSWILKALGGTPIDRSKHNNQVQQVVALFREKEEFVLGLAPEGTRSPVTRWKVGFYHIATQANIPILLVGFDYASKEFRIGPLCWPSGDINSDIPPMIEYFRTIQGRHPKVLPDYP